MGTYASFFGLPPHIVTSVSIHSPMMSSNLVQQKTNSLSPYHLLDVTIRSTPSVWMTYLTAKMFRNRQTASAMPTHAAEFTGTSQYPMTVATADISAQYSMTAP